MNQTTSEATVVTAADDTASPGSFSPGAFSTAFTVSHLTQGAYKQYSIDSRYINETGLEVLPTGDPGGDNVLIRVHSGKSEKVVYWTVERNNAMPLLPALTTNNANEVPIKQELLFCNVLPVAGGGQIWRASGINHYKLIRPKDSTSKYPIGSTPAELAAAISRFYPPTAFVTTILDASAASVPDLPINFEQVIRASL